MIHLTDEENALFEKLRKAKTEQERMEFEEKLMEIWDKEENHLRQFYRKDKKLWTDGYFCSTIGEVSEEIIKKYIENQG